MPEINFLNEILQGEHDHARHNGGDNNMAKDDDLNGSCSHEVKMLLARRVEVDSG